jgi:hypothetical protein
MLTLKAQILKKLLGVIIGAEDIQLLMISLRAFLNTFVAKQKMQQKSLSQRDC